jgi:hypothetical protein
LEEEQVRQMAGRANQMRQMPQSNAGQQATPLILIGSTLAMSMQYEQGRQL